MQPTLTERVPAPGSKVSRSVAYHRLYPLGRSERAAKQCGMCPRTGLDALQIRDGSPIS